MLLLVLLFSFFFFFNDTATTEIYTLSLHDALPIPPIEILGAMRMRYRRRSSAVAVGGWVAVALVWQGVVAAQDAEVRSGPAVSGELGAAAGPLLYRSAPRMAPKVG